MHIQEHSPWLLSLVLVGGILANKMPVCSVHKHSPYGRKRQVPVPPSTMMGGHCARRITPPDFVVDTMKGPDVTLRVGHYDAQGGREDQVSSQPEPRTPFSIFCTGVQDLKWPVLSLVQSPPFVTHIHPHALVMCCPHVQGFLLPVVDTEQDCCHAFLQHAMVLES